MNEIQRLTGRRVIKSLKARYQEKRTSVEKLTDDVTGYFGRFSFLMLNAVIFVFWVVINSRFFPVIKPFDPFPFPLLTTLVSLEAIILTILVLISQNRSARIDELREEVDLEVDLISERELTKILNIVTKIAKKNGIKLSDDTELQTMLKPLEEIKIEKTLERQV